MRCRDKDERKLYRREVEIWMRGWDGDERKGYG
jgi:hypothetical protein